VSEPNIKFWQPERPAYFTGEIHRKNTKKGEKTGKNLCNQQAFLEKPPTKGNTQKPLLL